jgi:hypothetical protein
MCVKYTSKSSPKTVYVLHISCIRRCNLLDLKLHLQCSVDRSLTSGQNLHYLRQYSLKHFARTYQHQSGCEGIFSVVLILGPKSLEYIFIIIIDPKKKSYISFLYLR